MRTVLLTSLLTLSLSIVGCSGESSIDDGVELADDGKQDGQPLPVGTFDLMQDAGGPFVKLVLRADGTFYRTEQVFCITAPCPPIATRGTMKFTRSGSHRYIRFRTEDGAPIDRYAYRGGTGEDENLLEIRLVGTSEWSPMGRSQETFCEAASECPHMNLPTPRCLGQWTCEQNSCAYACGQLSCGDAGGSCLQPSDCLAGGGELSSAFSCGGTNNFGTACCMKPVTCADAGGSCLQPSDCLAGGGHMESYDCGGTSSFGTACCVK